MDTATLTLKSLGGAKFALSFILKVSFSVLWGMINAQQLVI